MADYLAKRGANVAPSYATTGDLPTSTQSGDLVFVGGQLAIAVDASTFETCNKTDIDFPIVWSNLSHQAKIKPSDLVMFDLFGRNVAIDGNTLAIGSQDEGNSGRGEIHVYTRSGTTWSQEAVLVASDTSKYMSKVIIQGDTIVAGAYGNSVGTNTREGAAYVFTRSGTTWSQQAKLVASDPEAQDMFGYSIPAIDGDTVAVAAPFENGSTTSNSKGAVYVYTRSGTSWSQQAKITASDAEAGAKFGSAEGRIGLSADTLVVGAEGNDEGGTDRGAVYVFTRSGTTWSQQAKITAPSPSTDDGVNFGRSTDISGDTIVIGAPYDHDAAAGAGLLFVYTRSGTTWSHQATLSVSDAAIGDQVGHDVVIKGDVIVSGARQEDTTTDNSGALYVFTRSGTTWSQQVKKKADTTIGGSYFSQFVALSGNTVVTSGYYEDNYRGAVYVYTA